MKIPVQTINFSNQDKPINIFNASTKLILLKRADYIILFIIQL